MLPVNDQSGNATTPVAHDSGRMSSAGDPAAQQDLAMTPPITPPDASNVAQTEKIRADFPALARREGGQPVAYFDGPGGTQVPRVVVEAVAEYLTSHNANTHWAFTTSIETDAALARSRQALADFLNAAPEEIAFGANMTTLTFHLARALGRMLGPGDAIITTELDHHANIDPWQTLVRERGVQVHQVKMIPETGQLDWDDLDRLLTDHRTRLLATGAASNALGTINDIARAVAMAREAEAMTFVDAVHYAPHQLVDVRDWGCDFLACSAYKFYGPHVGVLYGRRDRIEALDVAKLEPAPNTAPERLETGTQNHEGVVGAAAAVDYLASLACEPAGAELSTRRERLGTVYQALHDRGERLLSRLWEGLRRVDGVRLFGPPPDAPRTPTLSFAVGEIPAAEVGRLLARRGVFASHGDFYASTVARRLGMATQGLVRIGCACYSTEEEVDRVAEGVRDISAGP
jgi:cysteine desulfurase family protein (TIGR01976 family)